MSVAASAASPGAFFEVAPSAPQKFCLTTPATDAPPARTHPPASRAMTCLGFAAPGLVKGSMCWLVFGLIATAVQLAFFVKETPKISKQDARPRVAHAVLRNMQLGLARLCESGRGP